MRLFLLFMLLVFAGCAESGTRPSEELSVYESSGRFTVEDHGNFYASSHYRHILIVRDSKSGDSYLAITGCGIYQMQQGKHTVEVDE